MIRIAILSIDTHCLKETETYLSARREIHVIGTATDGHSGLRLIRRERPDLVILSLALRGMDGLSVMRELQRLTMPPLVIVYTSMYTAATLQLAYKYGASYFFCQPIEMRCLYSAILDQYQCLRSRTTTNTKPPLHQNDRYIQLCLENAGISRRLGGSRYLYEAIRIVINTPSCLHNLTRNVYAGIAEHFHTSIACVERNIRTAICSAYNSGTLSEKYSVCPSNREFIRSAAEYILTVNDTEPDYADEL